MAQINLFQMFEIILFTSSFRCQFTKNIFLSLSSFIFLIRLHFTDFSFQFLLSIILFFAKIDIKNFIEYLNIL